MTLTLVDLREVTDAADDPLAPIPFERRRFERRGARGSVTAVRCRHDPTKHEYRIFTMELRDMSDGGLAGVCSTRLEADDCLAMTMPAQDLELGLALQGHVVHCRETVDDTGNTVYQIGVQLDLRPAA